MDRHMDILEKQEELLRFEKFDQETAFRLGCFMIESAKKQGLTVAVNIRLGDGTIVFQHLMDGTNQLNENWMLRKFNTVMMNQCSSLMMTYKLEATGEDLAEHGLSSEDYALCGGGFPIRLKGSSVVIGAVVVSNMYHQMDHEFGASCLREFLNCPEAPAYPIDKQ